MKNNIRSNFDMLRAYEAQLWRLGALAERYFAEDPNTSLLKLRQLSELLAQSTAQKNINLAVLNDVMVQCPSLDEQVEIVLRVEALLALADRIETRCTAARTQAQRLTPLVLAKAFRGELVPQDPSDEPASALLARIASSDTAVAGKNKRKVPAARKERAQAAINL